MLSLSLALAVLPVAQTLERSFDAPVVLLDEQVAPFRRLIDLDGDAFPDAVGAFANSNNSQFRVDVYQNDGQGGFDRVWSDASVVPGSPAAGHSPELNIAVADLDGDGDDDFCVTQGNQVWDFLLAGGSATPLKLDTSLSGVFGLGLADLDGDGSAEHVLSNLFSVLIEYADGSTQAVVHALYEFPLTLDESANVAIRFLDGDGDGDTDVLLAGSRRFQWILLDALGQPLGATAPVELGFELSLTDVGDVDGDGDQDAVSFGSDGTYRVLRQSGPGAFELEPARVGGPAEFLMDVDGDGDLDGVCCGGGGGTPPFDDNLIESDFEIAIADGAGNFDVAFQIPGLGSPQLAGVADVDRDGKLDLVAGRVVCFGTGDLVAEGYGRGPAGAGLVPAALAVDVDGDGDPDQAGGLAGFRRNLGNGRFEAALPSLAPAPVGTHYVGPGFQGDLDGDGDVDLLVEQHDAQGLVGMRALANTGGGHYADGGLASAPGESFAVGGNLAPFDAVFGDLDGDGDTDLATRSVFPAAETALWYQQPDGSFAEGGRLIGHRAAAIADFDQDGFVDLLAYEPTSAFQERLQMFVGGPAGLALDASVLAGQGWQFQGGGVANLVVVDLQGTGFLDVALASTSGLVLLLNRVPLDGTFAFSGKTLGGFSQLQPSARIYSADIDRNGLADLVFGPLTKAPRASTVALNQTGGFAQVYDLQQFVLEPAPLVDLDGDRDVDLAGQFLARGLDVPPEDAGVREQYGASVAGSEGALPVLGIVGTFAAGGLVQARVTGALGGTVGVLAGSFGNAELVDFPLPGLTALVDPGGLALTSLVAGGELLAPGAGSWSADFTLPAAFAGKTVYHQVFLFDPAGPFSLTQTNGLRLTAAP